MHLPPNKDKIRRCFRRSISSYDGAALVQKELARRLLGVLEILSDSAFCRVLEIGCCTGGLSEMLCTRRPLQTLYLNDLVAEFEEVVMKRLLSCEAPKLLPYFGDIETMAIPPGLSLVVSGATLQWLSDLPTFIARLGRGLESGAFLAFSLFGPGTLGEFCSVSSVGLPYHSDTEVLSMLANDFELRSYEGYQDQLFFPSVREVLYHIRATGIGGVGEYPWNKERLAIFEERYKSEFGTPKGLPVTYVSSCYVVQRR